MTTRQNIFQDLASECGSLSAAISTLEDFVEQAKERARLAHLGALRGSLAGVLPAPMLGSMALDVVKRTERVNMLLQIAKDNFR